MTFRIKNDKVCGIVFLRNKRMNKYDRMKEEIHSRTADNYVRLKAAIAPLEKYGWFGGCDENEARQTLVKFFEELKTIPTDEIFYVDNRYDYYSFYQNLYAVKKALEETNFSRACHEIDTLNYNERLLQHRVYTALMGLYHIYLE